MAYRWKDVECDTFEELQRLQGSTRTTSAVVKETRWQEYCRNKGICGKSVGNDEHCERAANHAGECS